jgi:hypothetical protein
MIRNETDTHYSIELHQAQQKHVTIFKAECAIVGDQHGGFNQSGSAFGSQGGQTPHIGGATPFGSHTPGLGGATPMFGAGGNTPFGAGGRTPGMGGQVSRTSLTWLSLLNCSSAHIILHSFCRHRHMGALPPCTEREEPRP